jgi:putative lipoic acid-binding regulatory protein
MTRDITFTETPLDADQEAPKIEFPCLYPIKVIGVAAADFQERAVAAVERYAGKIDPKLVELNPSKKGSYVPVRVTIAATGHEQLENIFTELKRIEHVKMVL